MFFIANLFFQPIMTSLRCIKPSGLQQLIESGNKRNGLTVHEVSRKPPNTFTCYVTNKNYFIICQLFSNPLNSTQKRKATITDGLPKLLLFKF